MFRRLIKFGDSSHVVSLPKKWIERHHLTKGDIIAFEEEESGLRLLPYKTNKDVPLPEITVTAENIHDLRHKIIAAYINNYSMIHIVSDKLQDQLPQIREIVHSLVALEIVQQTSKSVTLKDYLNVNDISLGDTIRRIDRVLQSMAEDVRRVLKGVGGNNGVIEQKEMDVNRLTFLMFKALKKCFDPRIRQLLDITLSEIIFYWEVVMFMERVGDQLKRIARYVKNNREISDDILICFDKAFDFYKLSMKAFYTSDQELALRIEETKRTILGDIENIIVQYNDYALVSIVEKMKNMVLQATYIAGTVITFNPVKVE